MWHQDATPAFRDGETRVARRIQLGDATAVALGSLEPELGPDAVSIALVVAVQSDCGGDLGAMIEVVAAAIDDRARHESAGRASAAGASLSSRMVAGLPLLSVPLLPAAHAPLFDSLGLTMLVGGVLLALCGLGWVKRLVPVPAQSDDPVAVVANVLASVLAAGMGLRMALDQLAPRVPLEILGSFCRARRRVTLGSTWPEALAESNTYDIRRLGQILQNAQLLGTPVKGALNHFADELRTARALTFEKQMRRAPVLMVLPLVLCILPSFLLLALGPFIRGLSPS